MAGGKGRSPALQFGVLAAFMALVTLLLTTLLLIHLPLLAIFPFTEKPSYHRPPRFPWFQKLRADVPPETRRTLRWLYRGGMRFTEQLWASFIMVFMYLFASTTHPPVLRVFAEPGVLQSLYREKDSVISGNHQSLLDWIYAWIIANAGGRGGDLKIFLKADIGAIPLLGNGIKNIELVLLKRNWQEDQRSFDRYMDLIRTDSWGYWTLIYAEGTTLDGETIAKSKAYAEKMGIEHPFTHSLLPRAMGLFSVLRKLGKPPSAGRYLYLVAQAYNPLPQGSYAWNAYTPAKVFFAGQGPESVEFRIWRFPIEEIPGILDDADTSSKTNATGTDEIIAPKPIHDTSGLRNRKEGSNIDAMLRPESTSSGLVSPTLSITEDTLGPPPPADDEPEEDRRGRGRERPVESIPAAISPPISPPRSRSLSPSGAHQMAPEEAARLDKFASWLTDRWLTIDAAMRNFHTKGEFGDEEIFEDMKPMETRQHKLQKNEIVVVPSVYDVLSLLVAVLCAYYPLMKFVAWIGLSVFWQLVGFAVLVGSVSAGGYFAGVLA